MNQKAQRFQLIKNAADSCRRRQLARLIELLELTAKPTIDAKTPVRQDATPPPKNPDKRA